MAQLYTGQVIPDNQPPAPSTAGPQEYNGEVVPLTDEEVAQAQKQAALEQEILARRHNTVPPAPMAQQPPMSTSLGSQLFSGVSTQDAPSNPGINTDLANTLAQAQAAGQDKLTPSQYVKSQEMQAQEAAQKKAQEEYYAKGNAIASSTPAQAGIPVLDKIPLIKDTPGLGQIASWPSDEAHAAVNFGHSVVRNFLGVDDLLNNNVVAPLTGVPADSNYAGRFDQAHPDYQPDNSYQGADVGTMKTGIGMGIGGGVGGAIGGGIGEAVSSPLAAAAIKGTGSFIGNAMGYGATQDPSTKPLLDPYIPGSQKKLDNTSPSFAGDMFNNEARNSVDGGVTGAAIGTATKLAKIPLNIVGGVGSSVFNWKNMNAMQREYAGQIADATLGLDSSSPIADRIAGYKELAAHASNPENNTTDVGFNDPNIPNINHKRDTISVLEDFIDKKYPDNPPEAQSLKTQLAGLRASMVKSGKAPDLETAVAQPQRQLDKTLGTIQTNLGGDNAIDQAHGAMVESGQNQINAAQAPVDQTQAALEASKNKTLDTIKQDPNFGPIISKAEGPGVNIGIGDQSRALQTEMVQRQETARQMNKADRDAAHAAIPAGTPADMESFNRLYQEAEPHLPEDVRRVVEANDGTYAYLYNKIKPALSRFIGASKSGGNYVPGLGDTINLQNNIREEQLGALYGSDNPVTADAAQAATAQDRAYGDLHSDSLGKTLKENAQKNLPDQPRDFLKNGRKEILSAITDPNQAEAVKQLRDTLDTPQGNNSGHLIDDVLLHEGAKNIVSKLSNQGGKLEDVNLSDLAKPLQDLSGNMSPAKAAQVQKFLDTIKAQGVNSEDLKSQLAGFQAAADDAKKQVYDGHLSEFFKKVGGKYEAQTSGFDTFDRIISKKGNESTVADLIKRAGDDPVAQDGLRAVVAKKASQEVADGGQLSEQTRKYGDMVFKDNPAIMEGVDLVAKKSAALSKDIKARNSMSLDTNAPQSRMMNATRQMVIWTFGMLSHPGAVLGGIAKNAIADNSSEGLARKAADSILSNSDKFGEIASQLSKSQSGKLTPAMKKQLFRIFVQGGLNLDRSKDLDLQTQDAMGQ